jgi:hypothetical protein
MPYYFFIWTSEIVAHLGENEVTPEEFEEIVTNPRAMGVSKTSGDPLVLGYTSTGRHLCCVFRWLDVDTIEPVTAFEIGE